jgi:predicted metal-binding membrane protein
VRFRTGALRGFIDSHDHTASHRIAGGSDSIRRPARFAHAVGLEPAAWHTAAVGLFMALWWLTEAIPILATALLPLVLFPLVGSGSIREAAEPFANPIIFLFMGGFLVALASGWMGYPPGLAQTGRVPTSMSNSSVPTR